MGKMIYRWSGSLSWTINQRDLTAAGKGDKVTEEEGLGGAWGLLPPGVSLQVLYLYPQLCGNSQPSDPESW